MTAFPPALNLNPNLTLAPSVRPEREASRITIKSKIKSKKGDQP